MCISSTRVWSCVVSPAQRLLSVTCTVEDVLSLLGQFLLTGEGAMLTCRAVASAHCSSARRGPPAVDHNYPLLTRAAL
jgi:hypothetical protein